jgi:sugar transferase (PEP-CTERM/EpsH1 system associated)
MKPTLLYLCHRIPYPPNKGDKIRSFHLLKHLARKYRIILGAFIDEEGDWEYTSKLDEWCEQTYFLRLNPTLARIKSLSGLVAGQALTLPYYYDARMARWINSVVSEEKLDAILIYSSAMAQYVLGPEYGSVRRIIDLVDVDSDKWRQYSEKMRWPMDWVYRREANKLFAFERKAINMLDHSFFVSSKEAGLFTSLAPETAQRVGFFNNGVDTERFSPELDFASPYPDGCQAVVFTGAMDYWPNEDAVVWFAQQVLPKLKQSWPKVLFYIVGTNPTERVTSLGNIEGVVVTGKVADVRPYIKHAATIVAPMRIARGIQNKVLEGMAMARPVVVTSMGLEGIEAEDGREVLVADDVDGFLNRIDFILTEADKGIGLAARDKVCRDFTWEKSLPKIDCQLE